MRLCKVNGKKALFHRWEQKSKVMLPSQLPNGNQGGTLQFTNGIVEYEDGSVESVSSYKIVFQDTAKLMARVEKELNKWAEENESANEADEEGEEDDLSEHSKFVA